MKASDIRKIVYEAVPEYRNLKWPNGGSRVHCSYSDKHKIGYVALGIGLLSPEAEKILDEVGSLKTTQKAITDGLRKVFGSKLKFNNVGRGVHDRYCHGFYFTTRG